MNILLSLLTSIILSRLTNNNILVFICVFIFSSYLFKLKYDKRSIKVSAIFAFFISLIVNSYINLNAVGSTKLFNVTTILSIIGFIPLITYILLFVNKSIKNIGEKHYKLDKKIFKNSKYSILRYFILIMIAWLPVMIAFYPGIFSYDAAGQLNQMFMGKYTTHHPMIHTLFLDFPIKMADLICGSGSVGLFIHLFIQAIIFALSLAYFIDFLSKEKASFMLKLVSLLSFMFIPLFPVMAVTATKDVLFSSFYLLLAINIIKFIKYQGLFIKKPINIISLIAFASLSLLFRNNTLYAFCLFLPFIIFYLRKYISQIVVILASTFLIVFGVNKCIDIVYEPEPGSVREALSLPTQFMGRLYNTQDNLTDKEKERIQSFYWNKRLRDYEEHISDPIKNTMYKGYVTSHAPKYIKLFFTLGFKYPTTLIDSFLLTNETYFNPFDKLPDEDVYRVLWEIRDKDDFFNYDIEFRFKESKLAGFYYALLETGEYNKFPLLKVIFNISLYIYTLALALYIFIIRKEYNKVLCILPFITLFITVLLGPVAILRYVLPIVLAFPLLIHMIIKKED